MRTILALFVVCFVVGCAGTVNQLAGVGVVKEYNAEFDNRKTVELTPNWLYSKQGGWTSFKMGALWRENHPDTVLLKIVFASNSNTTASYAGVYRLEINIGGQVHTVDAVGPTDLQSDYAGYGATFYTSSSNLFPVSRQTAEDMASADDVTLRIHTSRGHQDADFDHERHLTAPTAVVSLRKFLATLPR